LIVSNDGELPVFIERSAPAGRRPLPELVLLFRLLTDRMGQGRR